MPNTPANMDAALVNANTGETREQCDARHAKRNVWIVTAYAITGLAALGAIFYAVASYAAH